MLTNILNKIWTKLLTKMNNFKFNELKYFWAKFSLCICACVREGDSVFMYDHFLEAIEPEFSYILKKKKKKKPLPIELIRTYTKLYF